MVRLPRSIRRAPAVHTRRRRAPAPAGVPRPRSRQPSARPLHRRRHQWRHRGSGRLFAGGTGRADPFETWLLLRLTAPISPGRRALGDGRPTQTTASPRPPSLLLSHACSNVSRWKERPLRPPRPIKPTKPAESIEPGWECVNNRDPPDIPTKCGKGRKANLSQIKEKGTGRP